MVLDVSVCRKVSLPPTADDCRQISTTNEIVVGENHWGKVAERDDWSPIEEVHEVV